MSSSEDGRLLLIFFFNYVKCFFLLAGFVQWLQTCSSVWFGLLRRLNYPCGVHLDAAPAVSRSSDSAVADHGLGLLQPRLQQTGSRHPEQRPGGHWDVSHHQRPHHDGKTSEARNSFDVSRIGSQHVAVCRPPHSGLLPLLLLFVVVKMRLAPNFMLIYYIAYSYTVNCSESIPWRLFKGLAYFSYILWVRYSSFVLQNILPERAPTCLLGGRS